ncbi:MAG: DNA-binding protein [Austwickia sp.]|nr:DNA-binding protein [Austwickia sp.]MBK8435576.1 DNA-binding protein [Austwickia sp.]MBK9100854.1 DNA-binding protein [Austwickia sp.]
MLDPDRVAELDALIGAWLTVPDVAQLQGVPLSTVRKQLQDRELVAVRRGERSVVSIPEVFVTQDGPRPELRGTVTVLADGGMSDDELLVWLFTPDPTLPVPGSPMDALLAGHKTEVRRRAMEQAF